MPNGEVVVSVLPPYQTKGTSSESIGRLSQHLQEKMQKEFDRLNSLIRLDEKYLVKKVEEVTEDWDITDLKYKADDDDVDVDSTTLNPDLYANDDNNNSINEDENKKEI